MFVVVCQYGYEVVVDDVGCGVGYYCVDDLEGFLVGWNGCDFGEVGDCCGVVVVDQDVIDCVCVQC